MPSIPTYDSAQVDPGALPNSRQSYASPAAFTEAGRQQQDLGQSMMRAGGELNTIAVRMQDRENADKLFQADTAVTNDYLEFEKSARERRGDNAKGLTKEAGEWWDKKIAEHSQNLDNDVQRKLFAQQAIKRKLQSVDAMSGYEVDQTYRSLQDSANASIVSSINFAASQVGTPTQDAAIAAGKADILKRVQVMAGVNGWSSELRDLKEKEALSNLHLQVLQNMIDKSPDRAREYFALNKGEISGGQYDSIEKMLTIGGAKQSAFGFVERPDIQALSPQDKRTAARDFFKDNPEAREYAIAEIDKRENEMIQTRERNQRTAADSAWSIYAQTGDINSIPATTLAAMDGRDLESLRAHNRVRLSGEAVKTDFGTWYELRQQAIADPAGFAKVDLRRYTTKLSGGDLQELAKMQKDPSAVADAATLDQQLSNTHDLLGWGTNDREKKGQFDMAVTAAVNAEQQRAGKKLNFTERQQVIDRMLTEGKVPGLVWGTNKRKYFEVQGTDAAAGFVPTIPDAERTRIENALKRNGIPVTDSAVMRLYKQKHGFQ